MRQVMSRDSIRCLYLGVMAGPIHPTTGIWPGADWRVCQKRVSMAGTSNYISQILWYNYLPLPLFLAKYSSDFARSWSFGLNAIEMHIIPLNTFHMCFINIIQIGGESKHRLCVIHSYELLADEIIQFNYSQQFGQHMCGYWLSHKLMPQLVRNVSVIAHWIYIDIKQV